MMLMLSAIWWPAKRGGLFRKNSKASNPDSAGDFRLKSYTECTEKALSTQRELNASLVDDGLAVLVRAGNQFCRHSTGDFRLKSCTEITEETTEHTEGTAPATRPLARKRPDQQTFTFTIHFGIAPQTCLHSISAGSHGPQITV